MSDLTYCYTHMGESEIFNAASGLTEIMTCYAGVQLSNEELDIPLHMIPPEDETDALPCHVHPSYPYGNPTNFKHPAAFPYAIGNPASRALYEDSVHANTAAPGNAALRWQELALDQLLPVDETETEGQRAALARGVAMANAPGHNPAAEGSSDESEEAPSHDSEEEDEESAQHEQNSDA